MTSHSPELVAERYILAGLGGDILVFPEFYVFDVVLIDRTYVMRLPFYGPAIVGVVHHQGKVVPLLSLRHLYLKEQNVLLPGLLPVVRLSKAIPGLLGVGLVVDKVLASLSRQQYAQALATQPLAYVPIERMLPQLTGNHWLPQRWYALEA